MAVRKDISTSDSELFRQSVGPVKKIRQDNKHLPARQNHRVPTVKNQLPQAEDNPVISCHETAGIGDVLSFRRPGVQQRILSRLRKGRFVMEGELDLHGMTREKGRERLLDYLDHCSRAGLRCIRVIHGKGHGSADKKPVIKNMLNNVLRSHEAALAFCSAPPNDGGTGVAYVLLKRQGENDVNDY